MHRRKRLENSMDPAKLTASLTELVKKFVISFCEVNVGYHDRLDVFGSIHIRSDDSDVVAFVLNEHCYKKSSADASDDDFENDTTIVKKSKEDLACVVGSIVKMESQSEFSEGYSGHVKQEGSSMTDAIDIYSDGEETTVALQAHDCEDPDQNFIDHLLDTNKTENLESEGLTKPVRRGRGRPKHLSNQRQHFHPDKSQHQPESGYYQDLQDFKTESDFQNSNGYAAADVDYGPRVDGGDEYKFGSKFNEGPAQGSKKQRKRGSSIHNPLATSSLQGSYFQFESTYTCTACGCRFKSMDGLKCHVNSKHLQQKLYSCHFCSQTFLTRQASYSHRVKFHNISRPKATSSQLEMDFS